MTDEAEHLDWPDITELVNLKSKAIMQAFCGWLSGDIPELHNVEVPRLADSLTRFQRLGVMIAGLEVRHVHWHLIPIHELGDLNFAHIKTSSH